MVATLTPWWGRITVWGTTGLEGTVAGFIVNGTAFVNLAVYLAMGACVVVIFWRTNYQVMTVGDEGGEERGRDRVGVLGF